MVTTARLRLRLWRDEDLEPYAALNADLRVREFFPSVQTYQESADSLQFIRDHWQRRGFGLWAVEVIGGAPFIGFIGLSVPSFDAPFMPCVELGYRLAFDHWGHGYATEGSRAAIAFGFATLGLPKIVAMTTVHNERSRRVMERLGMTRDPADDFDHPDIVLGHPLRGHVLYRLTAAEWDASYAYAEARAVSHAESKATGAQHTSESSPPMFETRRIARLLKSSVEGPAYYGPSVLQALDGVTVDIALLPTAGGTHTIWRLVRHLTAELRHAIALLEGTAEPWVEGQTTWPDVGKNSAEAWETTVRDLVEANRALAHAIEALEDDILEKELVHVRSTYYAALHGYAQHNAYHAGQIALLKKQFASSRIRE